MDKKFFADLQKKPGTAAACERSERLDTLSGLSQASQLTDSVMLAHIFWKKHNYREWNIGVGVFEDESWCWMELSPAPITRRGDFLWWILCQMFADHASVYSCSV